MPYNNAIIVSHKYVTQPDDDIVKYFNKTAYKNVLHIMHSFSDAQDRCSFYKWYKKGILHKEKRTGDYKFFPEVLIYVKETIYTVFWIILSGKRWDLYIGMDGLCVFWGNFLRALRLLKKTVFWSIDFVPRNRFESALKNRIYLFINKLGYKHSDEMWDLSPRMAQGREQEFGITMAWYKKHRVVPFGVWWDRIQRYEYKECEKNTCVFVGHLMEKQGVQLVIKAIPRILKEKPEFQFKIIGGGSFLPRLQDISEELGVAHHCRFLGRIEDHVRLEEEIATSCVAIAPYIRELDTWTYYADPGKVKVYLACGVPVLLSDLPWYAREIVKNKAGKIVEESVDDIALATLELMEERVNKKCRESATRYSRRYNYSAMFSKLEL